MVNSSFRFLNVSVFDVHTFVVNYTTHFDNLQLSNHIYEQMLNFF